MGAERFGLLLDAFGHAGEAALEAFAEGGYYQGRSQPPSSKWDS